MNAIGPIEAATKAKRVELRNKFFPTPEQLKKRETEAEKEANTKQVVLLFKRTDINNCKAIVPMPTRRRQVEQIIEEVSLKHCIPKAHIMGTRRYRKYVLARQEAMYRISNEIEGLSLPHIGKLLGGKDHTTVLHGIRSHAKRLKEGEAL